MFGKVQEDSFQNIFDLSFDSDDNGVIGSGVKLYTSTSSLNQSNKFKALGGLHLDLDDHSSCWRDTPLLSPLEDVFSNEDDAFYFSKTLTSGSDTDKLKSKKLLSGDGNSSASSTCSNSSLQSNKVNTSRYKTELCRPFQENGACKYGEKCQFAHGHQELRTVVRHPKYKTDLCRTYHSIGFCPYGPRCHFIHSLEEAGPIQTSSTQQKNSPSTSPSPSISLSTTNQTAASTTTTVTNQTPTAAVNIKPLPMFTPGRNARSSGDANSLGLVGLGASSSSSGVSSTCSLSPNLLGDFDDLKSSESRLPVFSSLIK